MIIIEEYEKDLEEFHLLGDREASFFVPCFGYDRFDSYYTVTRVSSPDGYGGGDYHCDWRTKYLDGMSGDGSGDLAEGGNGYGSIDAYIHRG